MSPPVKPMLEDLELLLVQHIRTLEEQALSKQKIPGLDGAVYQNMGRCPTIFLIRGMLVGDTAVDDLTALRQKFQAHEPVSFVADIATETTVTQVLIDDLQVNELAGRPARFEYRLVLREYIPPPPPEQILDSPLNNEANGLFDDLTENLDILSDLDDLLGGNFNIADPTPPLRQLLDGFQEATSGLDSILGALSRNLTQE